MYLRKNHGNSICPIVREISYITDLVMNWILYLFDVMLIVLRIYSSHFQKIPIAHA